MTRFKLLICVFALIVYCVPDGYSADDQEVVIYHSTPVKNSTNGTVEYVTGQTIQETQDTIEMGKLQRWLHSSIEFLQEPMLDTCATNMKVAFKWEGKGKIGIGELGVGGNFEVTILNPKMKTSCK